MKVLQLTGYFLPEKAASIYLVENRLEAFAKENFDMVIHASRPTRGLSDEEYEKYKNKRRNCCMMANCVFTDLPCIGRVRMLCFGLCVIL